MAQPRSWTRVFPPLLASLVALTLLTHNVAVTARRGGSLNRYWLDVSVAIKSYLDWRFPPEAEPQGVSADPQEAAETCKTLVLAWTAEEGVRPWQPWRTMGLKRLLGIRDKLAPPMPWEDRGRPMALDFGFRLLGGVSPDLILWLGVLVSVPIFLWTCWEFFDAGHKTAGTVFLLTVASSPYFTDCLWWGHSAVGFYLLGMLTIVPLAVYAVLGHRTSLSGFFVRSIGAGTIFALCALCRGGTLMLVPGFLLALVLASFRILASPGSSEPIGIGRSPSRPMWFGLLGALILFWIPHLVIRQPQRHDVWVSIWEGLGDFDRTKGHRWHDAAAVKALHEANLAIDLGEHGPRSLYELVNAEHARFFREAVLSDIRADPGWYLAILGKRVFVTLTQAKLWPWRPRDGQSIQLKDHPNQGEIDNYYRATATADFLAFGRQRVEIPISVLVASSVFLLLVWIAGRWISVLRPIRERMGKDLMVVLCLAVAALGLPVAITTSAAQETQAFTLAYLLGFGFLLEEVCRLVLPRARTGIVAG